MNLGLGDHGSLFGSMGRIGQIEFWKHICIHIFYFFIIKFYIKINKLYKLYVEIYPRNMGFCPMVLIWKENILFVADLVRSYLSLC